MESQRAPEHISPRKPWILRSALPAILPCLLAAISTADDIQTDWSGGSGVWGWVPEWGDQFYDSYAIDWSTAPGRISLAPVVLEYVVDSAFDSSQTVAPGDINGDGILDIVGAASGSDVIKWWQNAGDGESWVGHTVDASYAQAQCASAIDVNGDGHLDILGAASYPHSSINWWQNLDGAGTSWVERTITSGYSGSCSADGADFDGDGDIDVAGCAQTVSNVSWWANANGSGTSWIQHQVDAAASGVAMVDAADVNGDGNQDILGALHGSDQLVWWENMGSGATWSEHVVASSYDNTMFVSHADVDGDGDQDVLGVSHTFSDISWWENIDGSGTSWVRHVVDGAFNNAKCVSSGDIDCDGDTDLLGAALWANEIVWYENMTGTGDDWIEHVVVSGYSGAISAFCGDMDGLGKLDVAGTAHFAGDVDIWKLGQLASGSLESSVLCTFCHPNWWVIDWDAETPTGTSVSFQVRAGGMPLVMGEWSDTLYAPCLIGGIISDGLPYVQYKAILESSDPYTTPNLNQVSISWIPYGIEDSSATDGPALLPVTPNPAGLSPSICFGLLEHGLVEISVFDISGRLVREIGPAEYQAGHHTIQLQALSSGIYFITMQAGEFTATQRFAVVE